MKDSDQVSLVYAFIVSLILAAGLIIALIKLFST